MRHGVLAACVLVPTALMVLAQAELFSSAPAAANSREPRLVQVNEQKAAQGAQACDAGCDRSWLDANLRINQIRQVGTAESAKQRPEGGVMALIRLGGKDGAEALDFGQPTLAAQLDQDARALQFDVVYDPRGGHFKHPAAASMAMVLLADDYVSAMSKPGFKVMHVPDVDYRASCLALEDCLKAVAAWSTAHPRHLPITIVIHTIDRKTPMPGATQPLKIDAAALKALDGEIAAVFAQDHLITPAMVRGDYASLREAAKARHWPLLGNARGKVMFVLDGDGADAYRGTLLFKAATRATPDVAVLSLPDPRSAHDEIKAALKAGLMVITRADADTREARADDTGRRDAAFASGAQVVLTDFLVPDPAIGPYRVSLADDAHAECGPALAPGRCIAFRQAPQPLMAAAAP